MKYFSENDILLIHSMVIDETGGSHGIRDRGAVESIVEQPKARAFGKVMYPNIFSKAAVYGHRIIKNHPFIDGNKRTGMTAAFVYLENNGYEITAKKGEIEKMGVAIASKQLEINDIAEWFKEHTKKI